MTETNSISAFDPKTPSSMAREFDGPVRHQSLVATHIHEKEETAFGPSDWLDGCFVGNRRTWSPDDADRPCQWHMAAQPLSARERRPAGPRTRARPTETARATLLRWPISQSHGSGHDRPLPHPKLAFPSDTVPPFSVSRHCRREQRLLPGDERSTTACGTEFQTLKTAP